MFGFYAGLFLFCLGLLAVWGDVEIFVQIGPNNSWDWSAELLGCMCVCATVANIWVVVFHFYAVCVFQILSLFAIENQVFVLLMWVCLFTL